jgi:hypothetical protein
VITGEHEFEAAPGLPEALPRGERILWQGRPDAVRLAIDAFHARTLAIYFAVLAGWRLASGLHDGERMASTWAAAGWLVGLGAIVVAIAACLALLSSRSTLYTVTDRRVVMRIGIVLTVTFNLPFRQIQGAALHARGDLAGDIALILASGQRIGWIHLWPHVRAWKLQSPQPVLRALPDARRVATLLSQALQASPAEGAVVAPAFARMPGRVSSPIAVVPSSKMSARSDGHPLPSTTA